jgi:hypothetical protein
MNRPARRIAVTCIVLIAVSVLVLRWIWVRQGPDEPVPSVASPGSSVPQPDKPDRVPELPAQQPVTAPPVRPAPTAKGPTREGRSTVAPDGPTTTERASEPSDVANRKLPERSPTDAPSVSTAPVPIVESIPDVSLHAEVIPVPEAPRAVPPTGGVTGGATLTKETLVLRDILRRYEEAYDRLDADAAAAIWSTVDSRSLARAFSLLRYQELDLDDCSIAVTESDATAQCPGRLRYARRIGDGTPKTEYHVWMIEFARADDTWRIVRVTAQ